MDLEDLREDFKPKELIRSNLSDSPIAQLEQWMQKAMDAGIEQPNAMALATANSSAQPSVRYVLLKEITDEGLIFYTDARSRKIQDLAENAVAAVAIHWEALHRQVRASGRVEMLPYSKSLEYFSRRPKGSQLAFCAMAQGQVIENRAELEAAAAEVKEVDCGHNWVGCLLVPDRMEFWQERESRLHDRFEYIQSDEGWITRRLAP